MIALGAGEAVVGMVGKDEFGHGLAGADHPCRICAHHHSLRDHGGAGGGKVPAAFNLYHADSAGSRRALYARAFEVNVAQCRYIYAD